jgi:DNA-binding response OmpR family regulator
LKQDVPLVMLVNDEPVMCDVMRRILQMNGYKVIVANDGATALEHTKQSRPDLVVLDLGLPITDKRELSAQIRKNADCPIIYFTSIANNLINEKAKTISGEVDAFITRPTSMKKILSVVGNTLGSYQRPVEAQV